MQIKTYIDGNSVGHAAQHGFAGRGKKLTAGDVETTAIFGILVSIQKILRQRTFGSPIVMWDGRSWRYERFADYKGTRTDTPEKQRERERYRVQRRHMFRGLHLLGVNQLLAGNMEADDMAAIMTRLSIAKGNMVTLITGDKDWLQLVEPGVAWVDHKLDRKCTSANFAEFTGFRTQKAFIHAKALQGDAGDNVKGCGGVGEKGALDLLAVFDCVHSFIETDETEAKQRYFARHAKALPAKFMKLRDDPETRARFELALELMDLNHPSIPQPENLRATRAPLDRKAFEAFCAEFAFMSLIRDMDNFLKPFIALEEEFGK